MLVYSQHEVTQEWGNFKVTGVSLGENKRWKLTLEDGRELVAAWNHWMFLPSGAMVPLSRLLPGDALAGVHPGVVKSVEFYDQGEVVYISIEEGHTYQNKGLTSHNYIKIAY